MKCQSCKSEVLHTGNEVVMGEKKPGESYLEVAQRSAEGVIVESYSCPVCGYQGITTYK